MQTVVSSVKQPLGMSSKILAIQRLIGNQLVSILRQLMVFVRKKWRKIIEQMDQ